VAEGVAAGSPGMGGSFTVGLDTGMTVEQFQNGMDETFAPIDDFIFNW
jgi:hypothetical protein